MAEKVYLAFRFSRLLSIFCPQTDAKILTREFNLLQSATFIAGLALSFQEP